MFARRKKRAKTVEWFSSEASRKFNDCCDRARGKKVNVNYESKTVSTPIEHWIIMDIIEAVEGFLVTKTT